jgi:Mitochondrial carrier protein
LCTIIEFLSHVGGSFAADFFSASVFLPTDIVSQRLQIGRKINFLSYEYQFDKSWDIIRQVWRYEGMGGFFRGLGPYVFVYGTASSIWWSSYEIFKHKLFHFLSGIQNPLMTNRAFREGVPCETSSSFPVTLALSQLVAGFAAGVLSLAATNPLDVARTRLQLLECRNPRDAALLQKGYLHILKSTFKNEGISGLYKGFAPRLCIRLPVTSLKFVGYEALKRFSTESPSIQD